MIILLKHDVKDFAVVLGGNIISRAVYGLSFFVPENMMKFPGGFPGIFSAADR